MVGVSRGGEKEEMSYEHYWTYVQKICETYCPEGESCVNTTCPVNVCVALLKEAEDNENEAEALCICLLTKQWYDEWVIQPKEELRESV